MAIFIGRETKTHILPTKINENKIAEVSLFINNYSFSVEKPFNHNNNSNNNNKASIPSVPISFVFALVTMDLSGQPSTAATTALVVATRAAVDRCGPGHVLAPLLTRTEKGQGRAGADKGPEDSSSPAGALQLARRGAWREASCQLAEPPGPQEPVQ